MNTNFNSAVPAIASSSDSVSRDDFVRVRFAPSPTGHLHIGSVRVALFNWLFARHNNGKFLLRIEDTDLERSKQEYTDSIFKALDWVDIKPDEPAIIQTHRLPEHTQMLNKLLAENKAYRCYCTPEQLLERLKVTHGDDLLYTKYDGHCRGKTFEDSGKPYAIRFALPSDVTEITFNDIVRGTVTFDIDQFDDFIIARSDGSPMYNFVVVVDDAFMRISHVIRGEDHISNTPKQILLYQACGYKVPQFAHLPLILGPSGERLSKRDAATSVLDYKENGYLPEALINYLVRLGWSHGDQEIFTRAELIQFFSLEQVGKKGSIFDMAKLDSVNGIYLRDISDQDLFNYIKQVYRPEYFKSLAWSDEQIIQLIGLYKPRVKTLKELLHELTLLYNGPTDYLEADVKQHVDADTANYLGQLIQMLESVDTFSVDILSETGKALCTKNTIKLVKLAQPLRIALVGKAASPGVFDLAAIIGKDETIKRLRTFLSVIK